MKKITLILTLLFNSLLFAQNFTVDGIEYTITSTADPYTVEVFDYTGTSTTVVIPTTVTYDGISFTVTTIGDAAFYQNSLNSVTIPDSVTTIGSAAFGNNLLTSVTIPNNVTVISTYAFINNNLTSVTIPDSTTTIGDYAFAENELTSVTSESLNPATLSSTIFDDRSSIDLTIPEGTTQAYETAGWTGFNTVLLFDTTFIVDGIEYTITSLTSPTTVEASDYTGTSTTVVIPTTVTYDGISFTVTTIGDAAFYQNSLNSVTIPDSVTTIGSAAFGNNLLTSVTIPNNVTVISTYAFINNNLTSVTIPDSTTTIGDYAFAENELTSVTSESLNPATLSSTIFDDRSSIDLTIPEGTTQAYETAGWTGFNTVLLFDTTFIVDGIEYTITSLTSPTTVEASDYTGTSTTVVIPTTVTYDGISFTVTSIGRSAFRENELTSITIPDSVTSIDDDAFFSNQLTSVTIPDSVTSIGNSAFVSNGLTSVAIGNSVETIDAYAFAANELTSVTIPDSVTTIGDFVFASNELTSVISESLNPATLSTYVFDDHSLIDLYIPTGTATTYETAGWTGFNSVLLFDETFIVDGIEYTITSLTSPTTVEASDYTGTSTTVVIPTTVTYDGISFTVTTIGDAAFYQNSLNSVTIPDSVTTIGSAAFGNNLLTSVTIPNNVTAISTYAFINNNLTSVTIPDSTITIGDYAFTENELTSVISESLNPATLSSTIFDDRSVIDLTIPEGTTQAYETAGWTGFKSITEANTLSTTENTILENLSFTSNANTIVITTTNGIRLERISLYNMSGQRVLISKQTEVSINHLASGVYIAQLTTNLGTVAKKFVK